MRSVLAYNTSANKRPNLLSQRKILIKFTVYLTARSPMIQHWLDHVLGHTLKMRRVLKFWAGGAALYLVCMGFVWRDIHVGTIPENEGFFVIGLGVTGVLAFYFLIRTSELSGVKNWQLACGQAMFAIAYDIALYAVLTPIRGGMLIGLPVIITFCAFSLRPNQTAWLSGFAIISLAGMSAYLHQSSPQAHPAYEETIFFLQATLGVMCITLLTSQLNNLRYRLHQQNEELIRASARIDTLAKTDELTNLANRRYMTERLASAEADSKHLAETTCLALVDLDHFKRINDCFGHAVGDRVLQMFATEAKAVLRPCDELARWGGEEFLLLMPNTALNDAISILERVATRVRSTQIVDVSERLRITFSAGLVECLPAEKFNDAIRRADRIMYSAKEAGRGRVMTDRAKF
jgi:diguanylate cyclase (GGDEF)-like protein